ncbi:1-phosphofructokinase family hexose kinase [Flavobacterium aquatile]|uniref:Phosphofructokinase n=1 Tax=Flavobacterium aquatile LMG 4008 = ATCC 11947 TaxID=1453498 RepID=A0A095SRI1_9FLAO|nr:1-phosphofructokinase family hexose kinase [Flavobacterium aquatile]KGD67172.1 phosphofructokinase [Flavobacterium aquatile LMG 4008 = ATCC 11947]OXA66673.1 phosphofructokinase [Flavobacterium aquatile] [Flavobacterium aquatile LMG 4008 = ATCC 11947]GEC78468.1 phosphofructokinase [Flavobacterium aquatile]
MKAQQIVTLTINPSLDKSTHFTGFIAEQKIRCEKPRYDAGGGGINVSKAISKLGGKSTCVCTSGGSSGEMLEDLIAKEKLDSIVIKTKNWTRENFIAFENKTKAQYRFGFPGNEFSEDEKDKILQTIKELKTDYLVISGSLNEGVATDFYQKIAKIAKDSSIKVIVDTSGEALKKVLETGVYLIKPNIGELAKLIGVGHLELPEVEKAAKKLIDNKSAEIVVVSLGADGAILVTKKETHLVKAPKVEKKSTVGAGDSMVGGMVWALSQNKTLKEVIQIGVCCGTAATMNEGTQLFKAEDVVKLLEEIEK